MARPLKQGVDYFPLDVHIDNKLKFIKIKYGIEGYGVIICLLQHIYSLSYWCSCTDDDILLLSDELKVEYQLLKNVIDESIKRKFFNKELYEKYEILTSNGIQKRYQEIVKRRKEVEIIHEYLVIDNNFGVNVNINKVNADIEKTPCEHDVDKSAQSKVNKIKEEDIIKDIDTPKWSTESMEYRLSLFLYNHILKNNKNHKKPNLQTWSDSIDKMLSLDKRNVEDVKKIITFAQEDDFWNGNVLSTKKLREKYDQLFIKMNKSVNSVDDKNKFTKFNQRPTLSNDELEKKLGLRK